MKDYKWFNYKKKYGLLISNDYIFTGIDGIEDESVIISLDKSTK
jgi:hypothetical protein